MLRTWDIFDTLITRRCVYPQIVFKFVEQASGLKIFSQARLIAESDLLRRGENFTLDDIYRQFAAVTGLTKDICDKLKEFELRVEFEESIPITENLRQVKAGDILISDMYLPENFLRRLLDKAGLIEPVEIVVTSGGKSSGRIWNQLAAQKKFVFHIGDNFESDVKLPRLAGFESAPSVLSNLTKIEQFLLEKDFDFGAYLREIRLRNPFSEEIKRVHWQLFTLNIGMLLIFVQQIDELQKRCGFEYLGFCGRDTHYLRLLYEKFKRDRKETPTPNDYLHYSRKLVRNSAEETAKYFSAKIDGRKALLLDLSGTGTHLHNLRENFDLDYSILIGIIGRRALAKEVYPNMTGIEDWTSAQETDIPPDAKNFFLLDTEGKMPFPDSVECLNRATYNSPVRLQTVQIGDKILPEVIFSPINDAENLDVMEGCLREVLNSEPGYASNTSGGGYRRDFAKVDWSPGFYKGTSSAKKYSPCKRPDRQKIFLKSTKSQQKSSPTFEERFFFAGVTCQSVAFSCRKGAYQTRRNKTDCPWRTG